VIPPDYCATARHLLADVTDAELFKCLSCNACRPECTLHVATHHLQPRAIVRLAGLGMLASALRSVDLWACLQCNHCSAVCPAGVKPSLLIRHLRREAVARGIVSPDALGRLDGLRTRLHRARWHAVAQSLAGATDEGLAERYDSWAATPLPSSPEPISIAQGRGGGLCQSIEGRLGFPPHLASCMTCGECTTVCPVAGDRAVFDPVVIFRTANLRVDGELLGSPSIWLCLGCESCTAACKQGVEGHHIIRCLQELAIERGFAPADMSDRVWAVHHALLPRYLDEVAQWLRAASALPSDEGTRLGQ